MSSQIISSVSSPKKKKPSTLPQSNRNPTLPEDLLLSCIARVSKWYYPTFSLVSKSFRSLLASPELYKTRSLLSHTETCLYMCIQFHPFENPSWFTLRRKPDQALTYDTSIKKKLSGYVFATVPIITHPPPDTVSSLVAVGFNIYSIGRSSVSVLDCLSNTWRESSSLPVKLIPNSACVLDQKIYVLATYKDDDSTTFQVFDTKTETWDSVPIPCSMTKHNFYSKSVCFDGKLHVVSNKSVDTYNSKEGKWDLVEARIYDDLQSNDSYCVIGNVLFSVLNRGFTRFIWYDTERRVWRELRDIIGLVGQPQFPLDAFFRLADYDGKMAVLWDECLPGRMKMICCAMIALERDESYGIWGKVEWFDHVLTVPKQYEFIKVLAATV